MNLIVGFDRELKLDWLDSTSGLCRDRSSTSTIAKRLDTMLEEQVAGVEARRKVP